MYVLKQHIIHNQIRFFFHVSNFIYSKCLDEYIVKSNYKCPHCKKSICDISAQWNFIRSQIKLHPIPNGMIPIEINDIIDTPMGKFQVIKINNENNTTMYEGKFVNWFINKEQTKNVIGILNSKFVKKNLYKEIHCNDCEKKSTSQFHFYGLECGVCGSFNTQERFFYFIEKNCLILKIYFNLIT